MSDGEIAYIGIRPDSFGWTIRVHLANEGWVEYDVGDAIQFHNEVERTIGRWLAGGPADFHGTVDSTEPIYVREDNDHGR